MTPAITLEELLAWNDEASNFWKAHLEANPALLELPCGIGGTANVQEFVRHIWGVELRWSQRIAGLPVLAREEVPSGPLDALFDLHTEAVQVFRTLLDDPALNWDEKMTLDCELAAAGCADHFPGARLRPMRSSTASAIGRNWLLWSARPASPRDSREICFSALLCDKHSLGWMQALVSAFQC